MSEEKPRAIAFLCHAFHRGGVTRWMIDAASAWVESGAECWFVAPTPSRAASPNESRPSVIQMLEEAGSSRTLRPHIVTQLATASFQYGTGLRRAHLYAALVHSGVPVSVPIVVSDDPDVWRGASMMAQRNPMIGVLHSDERKYYELASKYSGCVSAFVSVSRRITKFAQSVVGHSNVSLTTIPCGVPIPAGFTKAHGIEDVVRIAWVGRIEERQKRVSDIPRIVRAALQSGVKIELDVVGDGPDLGTLQHELQGLAQGDAIRVHGWRDRAYVQEVLRSADVLLLPSNFEGMPMVAMEALSQGCAVVASRTSGIEDWIDCSGAEGCLWTFAVGDVSSAARCLMECAAVPSAMRRERARQMAIAEFSIDTCIHRYSLLLSRLPQSNTHDATRPIFRARVSELVSYPVSAWRLMRLAARRIEINA